MDDIEAHEPAPHLLVDASVREAFDRVARIAIRLLGVPIALVTEVETDRQVFLGAAGLEGDVAAARETPLSHSFCRHVVATARPLVVEDAREDERLRDNLAIRDLGVIAYAGFPIYDGADPVGAFCAMDTEPHAWTPDELDLVRDLAAMAQSQLDLRAATRAADASARDARQGRAGAEAATEVLRRLTAVMDAARRAAGLDDLLERVVAAAAGALEAPAAMVVLADAEGGLRVRASVGVDEAVREQSLARAAGFAAAVLASDEVQAVSDLAVAGLDDGLLRGQGITAAIGAPMRLAGRAPGVIVIGDRAFRSWSELEIQLVRLAADRLGVSFERARVADQRHEVAERLQRALEPTRLPQRDDVRLAARYRPAEHRIGGDWYDAFELPGGRVGLAIGDVVGHGILAAAAAVRLRHFLRGFVLRGLRPGGAIRELDALVADEPDAAFSSVAYAELDPEAATLRLASAGHLPPVLLRDGAATMLESAGGALLGVASLDPWPERTETLLPGDRVVLYTDGLVERPGVPIDEDIATIFGRVRTETDLERLCHALVSARAAPGRDDVAVLAARLG